MRIISGEIKSAMIRRLWRYPLIFTAIYGLRGHYRDLVVNNRTEVVIEAFPRTANTFCVVAFEQAQQRAVKIAHHLHSPAQVAEGVRRRLPTMVVVRKPLDAVASLIIRNSEVRPLAAVRDYVAFHRQVRPLLPYIIVATFEEVITDFGQSIRNMNTKFKTHFLPFDPTEQNRQAVEQRIECISRELWGGLDEQRVARPSQERKALNETLKDQLMADPKVCPVLQEAQQIYEQFLDQALLASVGDEI